MSRIGSPAPRLLVVAMIALGLIGMHHLVVAACHHASSHSGHATTLTASASHDAVDHGVPIAPLQAPEDAPEGQGGLVGAAATCLAVLLMIVLLVLPHVLARVRRYWQMITRQPLAHVASAVIKPPDLTLLSVSRT